MNNTLKVIAFLYVYFFVDAAHAAEPAPANTDTAAGWIKSGSSPVLGTCFDIAVLREHCVPSGAQRRLALCSTSAFTTNIVPKIGIARSRDGMNRWERHRANPIIRPTKDRWDGDACYKPFAIFNGSQWLLW